VRYMMLIHHDEEALATAPKQQLWAEYAAFNEALAKAGAGFAAGDRLESSASATTVRVRDGNANVLDGPYADTKEQFAGYFMIDVSDLDEAIAWARRCPSSKHGCVEIRPFTPAGRWPSAWAKREG
jgi:hypothetical protein